MIKERYKYDGIPVQELNELQNAMKRQIDKKVEQKVYQFESVPCCICHSLNFEKLSEKDRYGLYMPVVICCDCGLIQTNPRMTQQSYNIFYNEEYRKLYTGNILPNSDFFNNQFRTGGLIFHFLNSNITFKKPLSDIRVIEIGCGAGGILQYFKEKGCNVQGVDLGAEYIEFGRSQYDLNLKTGGIADISSDEAFDIVIYSHVLEHILNPNEEIHHIKRILRTDGIVYIELPGVKSLRYNNYDLDFLKYLQNAHTYHFTLTTLNNLMQTNGYKLVAGNENIYSIFNTQIGIGTSYTTISDFDEILKYLRDLEIIRKLFPVAPYKIKKRIRTILRKILQFAGFLKTEKHI